MGQLFDAFDRGAGSSRAGWRYRLVSSTAIVAGAIMLVGNGSAAFAQDECGAAIAGEVTCTAGGNPYANGITYNPAGDFALTTTDDAEITAPIAVTQAGPNDLIVNHQGTLSVAEPGAVAMTLDGGDVSLIAAGDIVSTSQTIGAVTDVNGNIVTPEVRPMAVLVTARTGDASVRIGGDISTTGGRATAVRIVAADTATVTNEGSIRMANGGTAINISAGGGVTWINNGTITIEGGYDDAGIVIDSGGDVDIGGSGNLEARNGPAMSITARGGVSGMLAGLSNTDNNPGATIRAAGDINLSLDRLQFNNFAADLATAGAIRLQVANVRGNVTAIGGAATDVAIAGRAEGGFKLGAGTTASLRVDAGATLIGAVGFTPGTTDASIAVVNNGTMDSGLDFAGSGNSFVNNGTFAASGGSLGTTSARPNTFVNNKTVGLSGRGASRLNGVTSFQNNGVIDLRAGIAGSSLQITGVGTNRAVFNGGTDSVLYIGVENRGLASSIDRLSVDGPITGRTRVVITSAGSPTFFPAQVFAQGGDGTVASALDIAAPADTGLFRYTTSFDAGTRSFALTATPGDTVVRAPRVNEGAQQLWYRSADAVGAHFVEIRDARFGSYVTGGGRLWGTMYGQASRRRGDLRSSLYGVTTDIAAGYKQDTFGGQLGFDAVGTSGSDGFTVGVTGGYQSSTLNYAGTADRAHYDGGNAGLLLGFQAGGLFVNALAKFDYLWLRYRSPAADYADRFNGSVYGGQGEIGYRFGGTGFYVEPTATVAYSRTNLDRTRMGDVAVDFRTLEGLRGKAGARIGSRFGLGGGAIAVAYAQGDYVHEFKSDGRVIFDTTDVTVGIRNHALPDYGEGKLGFTAGVPGGVTGFIEGFGAYGDGYRGGGGRAGIRIAL